MTLLTNYGVTPEGFKSKRLIDIKNELDDYFIGEFGEINLDPQSVAGQIIGIYSKVLADVWENMQNVYLSQYPNSASGVSLDNVVQLNGLTRIPALQTLVTGVATGLENTLIVAGKLARIPSSNQVFFVTLDSYITRSNSVQNTVRVLNAAAQDYTVIISGIPYIYSLPNVDFSGPFIPANVITPRVNGINLPSVTYTTSSANTFTLLANSFLTSPAVNSATVVGNTIKLTPNLGFQIVVNQIQIDGGGPTFTISFDAPASVNDVAEYLAATINSSSNVLAINTLNEFELTAVSTSSPYSLNFGTNLSVISTSSPVPFLAQEYGPIPAPAGSLTEILTPVAGWQTINNFDAGVTGRFQETDEELRIRRAVSLRVLGNATVEAIRSRLLQEVSGVTSVNIFENVTLQQEDIFVAFSTDFIAGNTVGVNIDSNNIGTISFISDHITMMNSIAALIQSQTQVQSAVVGGLTNREITIEIVQSQEIEILFVIGGPTVNYIQTGGRPPKSFEAVVQGGSNQAVALKIWQSKPAGIQTFGNTNEIIVDSQGQNQAINFSRANPIYIFATALLVLNPQEIFPPNGQFLVAQAINDYGNSLGIGADVFIQRVQAAVFTVPGIANVTIQLARTFNPNETPSYGNVDILIGATETSTWNLSRIIVSI